MSVYRAQYHYSLWCMLCTLSIVLLPVQDNMDIDMAWLRGVALVSSNCPSLRAVCRLCGCLGKPPVCYSLLLTY